MHNLTGVNFTHFVDEKYYISRYGVRVIVLGEFHYSGEEDTGANFTQKVIRDCACVPGFAFFSKLTKVLRGRTYRPTNEEPRETWQHIAFYNFVQKFVAEESSTSPTEAMWRTAQAPFLHVVRVLEPDVILLSGSRLTALDSPFRRCSLVDLQSSRHTYHVTFLMLRQRVSLFVKGCDGQPEGCPAVFCFLTWQRHRQAGKTHRVTIAGGTALHVSHQPPIS